MSNMININEILNFVFAIAIIIGGFVISYFKTIYSLLINLYISSLSSKKK